MISTRQVQSLRAEARAIMEEWERGAEPDARAVLAQRPELRAHKSIVQDLAYEEYCLRCQAGTAPDVEAFCDRFPTFRLAVYQVVGAHGLLADDVDALAAEPTVRWPEPGERISDLMFLRELGRGAFGRVYLALEESVGGRPVAVKLSPEGAAEAHTMGRLVHPNIVPILSAGFADELGLTAVCMPFLGAATLTDVIDFAYPTPHSAPPRDAAVIRDAIRATAFSDDPPVLAASPTGRPEDRVYPDAVARIGEQIASALAHLHKEGVVHRDLKPSNVLLKPNGQALLMDFNLSADARAAVPRLGGTLPYMAPEQLRVLLHQAPGRTLDGRLDLFALGVILYELLTGRHPFGAPPAGQRPVDAAFGLLQRQWQGCPSLRTLNPAVDCGLARLVGACLAMDPAGRPASATALAAGLRRCLAWPARLRRSTVRRPWVAAAAAGLLLLAAGGAASELSAPQAPADVREYNRGQAAYLDGDYAAAESLFNQAVQDSPADPKPRKYYMARAVGAMRLGEAEADERKAKALFTNALLDLEQAEKQQSDGATLALLGYCNSRVGNHPTANLWYEKAVEAGFTSAGLYNDRGYSRLQAMVLDGAAQDFDSALQSDPNLQSAVVNRGLLILRRRNLAGAPALTDSMLADLQRAVELGLGAPELCISAARVFAGAAKEGRPSNPKICAAQALFCLQKATDGGADPKDIGKTRVFSDVLKDVPEFQTLMQAPLRPAAPMPSLPRLVDPAPYVPD